MENFHILVEFLLPSLAMCMVFAGIHTYLGMHVLQREVIFVDLALAQMAALGAVVAPSLLALGHGHHHEGQHHGHHHIEMYISFGFAALGALIFAISGRLRRYISQEAVVGIVYAASSACMLLVLSQSPNGGEEMKRLLGGGLLLTQWHDVIDSFLIYSVIGAALWIFRIPFHMLTWRPDKATHTLSKPLLWDFLFYLLFAVVLTVSIQHAGVLLVFTFLIVPAVITKLFWCDLWMRLFLGWLIAGVAASSGLLGAWSMDLPAGASVIVAFSLLLLLSLLVFVFRKVRS